MDWITLRVITKIVGSLAVVISLYLAKEVNNGMKSLKTTIRDSTLALRQNLPINNYYASVL